MEKWVQPVKFNSDRVIPGYLLLEADSTAHPARYCCQFNPGLLAM